MRTCVTGSNPAGTAMDVYPEAAPKILCAGEKTVLFISFVCLFCYCPVSLILEK